MIEGTADGSNDLGKNAPVWQPDGARIFDERGIGLPYPIHCAEQDRPDNHPVDDRDISGVADAEEQDDGRKQRDRIGLGAAAEGAD